MKKNLNRRDFLKTSSAAGLGVALGSIANIRCADEGPRILNTEPIEHLVTPPLETVRVGFVGIGNQGAATSAICCGSRA